MQRTVIARKPFFNMALCGMLFCAPASASQFFPGTTAELIFDIQVANANGQDDVIHLGGLTLNVSVPNNFNDGHNALPSITADGGNALTIRNGTIQRQGSNTLRLLHVGAGATLLLEDMVLRNGFAETTDGGAIYNRGALTISRSLLEDNSANFGGAVVNAGGANLAVTESTLDQNAAINGGAIFNDASAALNVIGTSLTGNLAINGGAIYNLSSVFVLLANSTLSGNQATGDGGAMQNDGTVNLIGNCTITNNTAGSLGGGVASHLNGLLMQVRSTIIAGNSAQQGEDMWAAPIDESNNLIGDNNGTDIPGGTPNQHGSWVGTFDVPISAGLLALANNGGPTQTHELMPNSVAINHGSNLQEFTFDQRGAPFARTAGASTDIGAYEFARDIFKDGFE